MFCLRSWIPILFFLTNASPIYLILFISATYFLNRPCVYCSLLLAVLVIALFDFHSNWFEPRYSSASAVTSTASELLANGTSPISGAVLETISLMASVVNSTAAAVVEAVGGVVGQRASTEGEANSTVVEWIKGLLRKEWRVSCMDVVVRF
ncbi:hypothetical protein EJ08DRAFT_586034 [Tothia fuscella]|uniref:Uncharacterized protein n=1 Tax=Tothia fuscella TaxID=1048955 RepID=A0A9P4NV11_9PEZI|nr:hypothetical protein EJ08DRAFT_586034 [Tothia fuscella]